MEAARGKSKDGRGGKKSAGAAAAISQGSSKDKSDSSKKKENVMPAGSEHNRSVNMETEGSLNTKAVGQTAAANSASVAGSKRGRKPKVASSQSNTMLSMGWTHSQKKKRSRSSRRDSSDEELCEESKSQKMEKKTPKKKTPKEKKTPVKPKNSYANLVDALEKNGELSDMRAEEYSKLLELTNKQSALYGKMEQGLKAGDAVDMARFSVLSKMYDKVGNRCHKRLNNLADTECKAITYESPTSDSSTDTTLEDL